MIFTASNFGSTWAQSSETFQISGVIFPCWPWTYCLTLQGSLAACRTERPGEEQSALRALHFFSVGMWWREGWASWLDSGSSPALSPPSLCLQLVEQPLTLLTKGLDWEMLSAQQPLDWFLKGGIVASVSEQTLLFVVSAGSQQREQAYWIRSFEIGAPESVFPRIVWSYSHAQECWRTCRAERTRVSFRGRLASVHLWPGQLFHLPKSQLIHL